MPARDNANDMVTTMSNGFESISRMIANLIQTLIEMDTRRVNRDTALLLRRYADEKAPFSEKVANIRKTVDAMHDPETENAIRKAAIKIQGTLGPEDFTAEKGSMAETRKKAADMVSKAASRGMLFSERTCLLQKACALAPEEETKEEIRELIEQVSGGRWELDQAIEDISSAGYEARAGMKEMAGAISKMGISKQQKKDLIRAVRECEYSLTGLCSTKFPADAADRAISMITRFNLTMDPATQILRTSDGGIAVITDSSHAETMNHILSSVGWSLGKSLSPSEEELADETVWRSANKSKACTVSMNFKDAAFAQKTANEINKQGGRAVVTVEYGQDDPQRAVSAKVVMGTTGTQKENDRVYSQMISGAALAALQLAGPQGKETRDRMNHQMRVEKQIDEKLKQAAAGEPVSGRVYFAHRQDGKYLTDSYVEFGAHKFTPVYNGVRDKMQSDISVKAQYMDRLKTALAADSAEKVYISDQEIQALRHDAAGWQTEINSMLEKDNLYDVKMKLLEDRDMLFRSVSKSQGAERQAFAGEMFRVDTMISALTELPDKVGEISGMVRELQEKARTAGTEDRAGLDAEISSLQKKLLDASMERTQVPDGAMEQAAISTRISNSVFRGYAKNQDEITQAKELNMMLRNQTQLLRQETTRAGQNRSKGPLSFENHLAAGSMGASYAEQAADIDRCIELYSKDGYIRRLKEESRMGVSHYDAKSGTMKTGYSQEEIENISNVLDKVFTDGMLTDKARLMCEDLTIQMDSILMERVNLDDSISVRAQAREDMERESAEAAAFKTERAAEKTERADREPDNDLTKDEEEI